MNAAFQRSELRMQYLQNAVRHALKNYAPAVRVGTPFEGSEGHLAAIEFKDQVPKLSIRLKIEGLYRSSSFQNLLGNAILHFQHSLWYRKGEGQLLIAVYFDRYPPRAERDLADYSKSFLGGKLNWLIVSREGRCGLRLFGQEVEFEMEQALDLPAESAPSPSAALFSAKNQWLLKCMLLPGLDPQYWGGPGKKPRSVGELAELAGVPQSTASAFIKTAESADYLRRSQSGFAIVRHRELLNEWHYALKRRTPVLQGVRPLYGPEPEERWLQRIRILAEANADKFSVAIGSHLACHLLNLGRSNQRGALLHVQWAFGEVIDKMDFVADDSAAPWMYLVRWSYPKLVFGGAVRSDKGFPVVDILQTWLDVRQSPARGLEQADYLYDQVLAKHFASKG